MPQIFAKGALPKPRRVLNPTPQAPRNFPASESIDHAEQDPFVRAMLLAEDMEVLKAAARNDGDAAKAAQYSEIETFLLRAAAGIQAANDQKAEDQ